MAKSRHSLNGGITTILPGVAIYKTNASPYYLARIRVNKKYVVRSTKETTKTNARTVAQELARELHGLAPKVSKEYTFRHYALKWIELSREMSERGEKNANYVRTQRMCIEKSDWGLLKHFGDMDVRAIKTRHFLEHRQKVQKQFPSLAASTLSTLSATFRNVLKVARDEGVIDNLPDTPRVPQKDAPRSFFRFHPLVPKERDEYRLLCREALQMARDGVVVRGVPVTVELYDMILFMVHSFVRPITTELYAIKHKDIEVATAPKRLLLTVMNGKTGYRVANTMPAAVSVYQRICRRHPNHNRDDYIFLPQYKNRSTAARIMQRQFNELLARTNLKTDPVDRSVRSTYNLRHTAICMRIINSEGKVNLFNLAKTAGTSVEQIERFYTHNLPLSAELARNLQVMVREGVEVSE